MSTTVFPDRTIVRPLTAQEEIYWQLTFNDSIHPVLAAHVCGSTLPGQWRAALDALQMRHPSLSVSIEIPGVNEPSGQTKPFFRIHSGRPIPLKVFSAASAPKWEKVIEQEISIPFRPGEAPLARAVLIYGSESSIFILSACHSICDGISLSLLMRDTLSAVAGQTLKPLAYPRSAEELLHLAPVSPPSPATDTTQDDGPVGAPPAVSSLRFTTSLTKHIVDASRQHGTTVNGALAAAVVLAMRKLEPRFMRDPVRMISPVNVRHILRADEGCGLYFISPKTEFHPAEPSNFWDVARRLRRRIVDASTQESLIAATTMMQKMTANGLSKEMAADTLNHAFAIDILFTNLGQLPYEPDLGKLKLESLSLSVLGGRPHIQTVGVATTRGSLCLTLTSRQPIDRLLETTKAIVADYCA